MSKTTLKPTLFRELRISEVDRYRHLACQHYETCLMTAASWPGFICTDCPQAPGAIRKENPARPADWKRCAKCRQLKPIHSRGLCSSCYLKVLRSGTRDKYPVNKMVSTHESRRKNVRPHI